MQQIMKESLGYWKQRKRLWHQWSVLHWHDIQKIFAFEFLLRFSFSGSAAVCTSHLVLARVLFACFDIWQQDQTNATQSGLAGECLCAVTGWWPSRSVGSPLTSWGLRLLLQQIGGYAMNSPNSSDLSVYSEIRDFYYRYPCGWHLHSKS